MPKSIIALPCSMVSFLCASITPNTFLPCPVTLPLNRLDLEMQSYQGKYQSLKVLNEIIEDAQALRILRFGDIDERTDLGGLWGRI